MAQNPDVINPDGSVNMNTNAPLMFPVNLTGGSNDATNTTPSSAASQSAATTAPTSSSTPSSTPQTAGNTSGAGRTVVSGGLLVVAGIAASFLAL